MIVQQSFPSNLRVNAKRCICITPFTIRTAFRYMDHKHIDSIEYGNEPDHWSLYKKAFRPAPYTFEQYMTEFTRHAEAVAAAWPSNLPFTLGSGV